MDTVLAPFTTALGYGLTWIYSVIPSLGWSIVIMTIVVMLLLFPLNAKQTKSMLAMQQVQPQIKAIQQKYKGDKQKLNEEMMKFYQENKINPLAGCLPLVVQMPILFGLFRLMKDPQKYVPISSKLYAALCQGADISACSKAISANGFPKELNFLGLNLHFSALGVKGGWLTALPYFLLVVGSIAAQFFQSVQTQRGQANLTTQTKIIGRVMPLGIGVISINFPAGTVLYWMVSAMVRIGQQELILRKITLPHRSRMEASDKAKAVEAGADDVEAPAAPRRQKKRKKK